MFQQINAKSLSFAHFNDNVWERGGGDSYVFSRTRLSGCNVGVVMLNIHRESFDLTNLSRRQKTFLLKHVNRSLPTHPRYIWDQLKNLILVLAPLCITAITNQILQSFSHQKTDC